MDDIEQAIDEELMKLNLHPSENDSESDDDIITVLDGFGNVSGYFMYFVNVIVFNRLSNIVFQPALL